MKRYVFFIFFAFSFSNLWGSFSEAEIKKAWTDTGYDFEVLFKVLNADYCSQSEKRFSACLMAFNGLLSSIKADSKNQSGEFYQLRISDSGRLEIVSLKKEDYPEGEDFLEAQKKRRESFRLFFRNNSTRATNPSVKN